MPWIKVGVHPSCCNFSLCGVMWCHPCLKTTSRYIKHETNREMEWTARQFTTWNWFQERQFTTSMATRSLAPLPLSLAMWLSAQGPCQWSLGYSMENLPNQSKSLHSTVVQICSKPSIIRGSMGGFGRSLKTCSGNIVLEFPDAGGQSWTHSPIARQNFLMPSCWNESTEALMISSLKMERCMEHAVSWFICNGNVQGCFFDPKLVLNAFAVVSCCVSCFCDDPFDSNNFPTGIWLLESFEDGLLKTLENAPWHDLPSQFLFSSCFDSFGKRLGCRR